MSNHVQLGVITTVLLPSLRMNVPSLTSSYVFSWKVVVEPFTVQFTTFPPPIPSPATVTPATGVAQDFSQPVTYTVVNNSAKSVYTVHVIAIDKPSALFVGAAPTMNELDPEAKTACQWMLGNISNSLYASFADIQSGSLDLSECKVIWWHYHVDGGVDGHPA